MPSHIYHAAPKGADLVSVTPVLDTSAYAAGDVLFTTTTVTAVSRLAGSPVELVSLYVVDKDDQKPVLDLYLFDRTVTFGPFNAAPAISDADAGYYIGHVSVATADYKDLGGVSVAKLAFDPLILKLLSTSLFIAGVNLSGTPTHTASGLVLKLGINRL